MKKGWIVAASLLFLLAIFTFGFSLFFLLLDSLSILITGLFSVPVYVSLYKNGLIGKKQVLCCGLLSFVFCADVVVSVLCYRQVSGVSPRCKARQDMVKKFVKTT